MKLGIKQLAVYAIVGTLGLGTLTSCGNKKEKVVSEAKAKTEAAKEKKSKKLEFDSVAKEELYEEVNKGDTKVFEPGKHNFFVRTLNIEETFDTMDVTGGSLEESPEGYEVFSIEGLLDSLNGFSTITVGYDVWYQNTETVEVEAFYNESLEKYDYSHFGSVVETKENQVEESKQKIK